MTTTTPDRLPPLVSLAEAAKIMGIGRTRLWELIQAGKVPVVHTRERKRWVPVRALRDKGGHSLGYTWPWDRDLTRQEFADLHGWVYTSVVRAVARNFIPTTADNLISGSWIASLTSREACEEQQAYVY